MCWLSCLALEIKSSEKEGDKLAAVRLPLLLLFLFVMLPLFAFSKNVALPSCCSSSFSLKTFSTFNGENIHTTISARLRGQTSKWPVSGLVSFKSLH